jgi:hypothetical protein
MSPIIISNRFDILVMKYEVFVKRKLKIVIKNISNIPKVKDKLYDLKENNFF